MAKSLTSRKGKVSSFPRDALEQAETVKTGWSQMENKLLVPNLTIDKFLDKLQEAKEFVELAEQLKLERAKAIHKRNKCLSELWDLTKRIRNAAKATFGDYSSELDLLSGPQSQKEPDDTDG
jgi:cell shape-determining protein MreC